MLKDISKKKDKGKHVSISLSLSLSLSLNTLFILFYFANQATLVEFLFDELNLIIFTSLLNMLMLNLATLTALKLTTLTFFFFLLFD